MYSHQLEKMAELVAAKLTAKPLKTKKAINKAVLALLQDYWKDKIAITWDVRDVHSIYAGLTDEQAMEVLREANRNHDAEQGVNWDTLRYEATEQFGENPEEEEEEEFDNTLIRVYKLITTPELREELSVREAAFPDAGSRSVEQTDHIDAIKRVLELREKDEDETLPA